MEFDHVLTTVIVVIVLVVSSLMLAVLFWRLRPHPWLYMALITLIFGLFAVHFYRQRSYGTACSALLVVVLAVFETIRRTRKMR
jgi:hypothetical protein